MPAETSEEGPEEEAQLTWRTTPFSATDFVAGISRRPGMVAVPSTSVGGKGDSEIVIPTSRYDEAVRLFHRRSDFPPTTDGVEDPPRPGVLRGGKDGIPQHMRTDRDTAVTAIMQAKEPYGSPVHKFIFLAAMQEIESPAMQETTMAALPEARDPQFSRLLVDGNNNPLPLWGVKILHDTGIGVDADYSGRLSDPKTRAVHDGRVFGGAQTGASGEEGARRNVQIGSAEEERVMTEAVDTTVVECMMVFLLWDMVAAVARSGTLFEQGLWLNGNVVGIAKVKRKVSLVKTKPGTTFNGQPWVYFTNTGQNWDYCGTGPFFLTVLVGCTFSGNKNLATRDRKASGMEVGCLGDFSSPQSRGENSIKKRKEDLDRYKDDCSRGANSCHSDGCTCKNAGPKCTCRGHHHVKNASVGGINSGPGGNQTGKPRNIGAGADSRDYREEGAGERYYGLHLEVSTDKLAVELARLVQEDGSLLEPLPLCGTDVAPKYPGPTKRKGRFGLDREGRLVMGIHNSHKPNVCVSGGTIPVTTGDPPFKVPRYAIAPLREGKIVIRVSNNRGALRAARANPNNNR